MLLLDWYFLHCKPLCTSFHSHSSALRTYTKVKTCQITRLDDLPDEILLLILDYLSSVDILRAFSSKDQSDRFHSLIHDYRTQFELWNLCYSDFRYLVDHIFSHSELSDLSLSNAYIPCLIEHFTSLCPEVSLMQLRGLRLDKYTSINPALLACISKQSKLESFSCDYLPYKQSPLTLTERSLLRDLFFKNDFNQSLHTLCLMLSPGLVLSNQLPSKVIAQLRYVQLELETFDDLCILLSKKFLLCVEKLSVYIKEPRQCSDEQSTPFPLHDHLEKLTLIDYSGGLTLTELASVLCAMPVLTQLYLTISGSSDISFAQCSLVEAILPSSLIELHYKAFFATALQGDITNDTANEKFARFPMKIINRCIYTIPLEWQCTDISVPATYYEPDVQRVIKNIYICRNLSGDDDLMNLLQPWHHVHSIESTIKLPSLKIFRRLQRLSTSDSNVIHATLPPTLRSLKLLNTSPLAVNAPMPTVVHHQLHQLKMIRPILNEQDLRNLLHQFPNLRYLWITLPSNHSELCLKQIFQKKHVWLPHLICLRARGGAMNLWSAAPYEWLISNTDLKYSFNLFHAAYNENDGLVVWL